MAGTDVVLAIKTYRLTISGHELEIAWSANWNGWIVREPGFDAYCLDTVTEDLDFVTRGEEGNAQRFAFPVLEAAVGASKRLVVKREEAIRSMRSRYKAKDLT